MFSLKIFLWFIILYRNSQTSYYPENKRAQSLALNYKKKQSALKSWRKKYRSPRNHDHLRRPFWPLKARPMNNGRPGVVGGPSGVYRKLHPAPANVIQNDFNPAAAAAATTVKISSAAAGQDLSAGVTGSDGSTWSILPPPPPQQQNGRIVVFTVQ